MAEQSGEHYVVKVEGEGVFTFRWRNMRTQMVIECEYARLTEGMDNIPEFLDTVARAMADLIGLTVESPEGWNVYEMDGGDGESYGRLMKVWSALRDKEASFRGSGKDRQAQGAGDGGDISALVSTEVQPPADGPSIP